jgi:hypothetical protein
MALSKTQDIAVLTIQHIAAAAILKSSVIDVTDYVEMLMTVDIGRDVTTALTAGVIVRIQASPKSSGDDFWEDIAVFQTAVAASESEAVSGTVAAAQAVVTVASTTNLVVQDLIFIKNSTIGNSEFRRIIAVSTNTSVTVADDLTNAQTGSTLYDQAERFATIIPTVGFARLRVMVDNSQNATQTVCAQALASAGSI